MRLRRERRSALALTLAVGWSIAGLATQEEAPTASENEAAQAARLLGEARQRLGLGELSPSAALDQAARRVLARLQRNAALQLPSDEELENTLREAGYVPGRSAIKLGDSNVGWRHLFEGWLGAPQSHADSLFGDLFRDVGVAVGPRQDDESTSDEIVVVVLALDQQQWFERQSAGLGEEAKVRTDLLRAVNEARAQFDRPPLIAEPRLDRVADRWARELARSFGAALGDEPTDGRRKRRRRGPDLVDLAMEERYRVVRIEANELRGTMPLDAVVDRWMRAADSQARLLNPILRDVGTGWWRGTIDGESQVVWVQVYGRPGI